MEWEQIPPLNRSRLVSLLGRIALKKLKMITQGAATHDSTHKTAAEPGNQWENPEPSSGSISNGLHQTVNVATSRATW